MYKFDSFNVQVKKEFKMGSFFCEQAVASE